MNNFNKDYARIVALASEYEWNLIFSYDGQINRHYFSCKNDKGTEIYSYQTESSRESDTLSDYDYDKILSQLLRKVY